jgi:hypothetical protein
LERFAVRSLQAAVLGNSNQRFGFQYSTIERAIEIGKDTPDMTQEIESIKPALSVILDDGDFIINSTGPVGKAMLQAVLPLASAAKKVTLIQDGEMKVLKRGKESGNGAASAPLAPAPARAEIAKKVFAGEQADSSASPGAPDIQDQFAADLAAGRTGEAAMGESPAPTPGPSDPVAIPAAKPAAAAAAPAPTRRKPQIFQDAAAPPAPELAEAEMARLLAEAAQAEADSARVAEDQRFQRQQAVQTNDPTEEEPPAAEQPRRRQRNLAVAGSPCGRCNGSGVAYRIDGDGGAVVDGSGQAITGVCNVCAGTGQVKKWGRGR